VKPPISLAVPALTKEEHSALKALREGQANEGQQVLALAVIVKKFAQPQDLLFIPGSPDETGFVNGRAFVAAQIRKYLTLPVSETGE
jgi:hypothetical protein